LGRDAFFADAKARTTLWNLLVLGEAAKRVRNDIRMQFPKVQWRRIAGFRDTLAHAYFGLDEDIVWDVVVDEIPALLDALQCPGLE